MWPDAHSAGEALEAHFAITPGDWERVTRKLTVRDLESGLADLAPAIVVLPSGQALAVAAHGVAITPQGRQRVPHRVLRRFWEDPLRENERAQLAKLPVASAAKERLIAERIRSLVAATVIACQSPASAHFGAQLSTATFFRRLVSALVAHGAAYGLILLGWVMIGQAAFSGRWDEGWFWGWAVLLAASIPLDVYADWQQAWLATAFGGLLKQRLLASSLAIDSDKIRTQGVGELLSKVFESEALESLSLSGGTTAILAVVELGISGAVILAGSQPGLNAALLGGWILVSVFAAVAFARVRRRWMDSRLALTHRLVENMSGHRTRIAQQPPALWHEQEDAALREYEELSAHMDAALVRLSVLVPRGWLMLGCVSLSYSFAQASGSVTAAGITLGGVLLGYQALRRLTGGAAQLAAATQSWDIVRELFLTNRPAPVPNPGIITPSTEVLTARNIAFTYPRREQPVLREVNLTIHRGERVLLEGVSGGGKSTFGALVAGLRLPTSGLLLSGGIDLATLGELGWRRRVATAPQYHENHILSATLLFNLLMSRAWPPSPGDRKEAAEVCRELGLGPLLERMPAGLYEMVGDSGWQLSQGERSRVFLARALLQGAELVVLDESFAALDPESLEQCLETVLRRAPSLLVIAHP